MAVPASLSLRVAAGLSAHDLPLSVPSPDPTVRPLSTRSTIVSLEPTITVPFNAIRRLFDHLRAHPEAASALNATYPKRGVLKTAATQNASSDQKFTIDISRLRSSCIPDDLRASLAPAGFNEVLRFFSEVEAAYVGPIMDTLSRLAGADLGSVHRNRNVNYRLCDYNTATADPESENGCGAHTDYGTFSIIFQDGTPGLEMEDAEEPGTWVPLPGDAVVVLAGWCAVILSGGTVSATRHRVRRTPGVRRLSAVLFVAPDLDVKLRPLDGVEPCQPFSREVVEGKVSVEWFKEVMGKRWRYREGNEELGAGPGEITQDSDIERLIWG